MEASLVDRRKEKGEEDNLEITVEEKQKKEDSAIRKKVNLKIKLFWLTRQRRAEKKVELLVAAMRRGGHDITKWLRRMLNSFMSGTCQQFHMWSWRSQTMACVIKV